MLQRLSPAQFRALIKARGYSFVELARLWGVSAARVTQMVKDADRPAYLDYALWGLPARSRAFAVGLRRGEAAAAAERRHPDLRRQPRARAIRIASDSTLEGGDVYIVHRSQGEHLQEGARGAIIGVEHGAVWIGFESGYVERFPMSYLESTSSFLVANGEVNSSARGYRFTTSMEAQRAIVNGSLRIA